MLYKLKPTEDLERTVKETFVQFPSKVLQLTHNDQPLIDRYTNSERIPQTSPL
jgi:hypothetical protein